MKVMNKITKILAWLPAIFWMGLIFYLSHQPATESSDLSSGVAEKIMNIIKKMIPNVSFDFEIFHHIVRKNAHFFAYLILGVLIISAINITSDIDDRGYRIIIQAIIICVLYAISDEVHQLFIPGRAGQVRDVMIDSAGATVGSAGTYFLLKVYTYFKTTKKVRS